jgi:IclR family acetate operon transcriptional repressor
VSEAPKKRVPAVANALAILEHLHATGNEPLSLSEIARATAMNVSTCFNILKTLEDGHVIAFDPASKTYQLGLHLAELGAVVDQQRQGARLAMEEVRRVADILGTGCFLMTFTDRERFVVLDKADSKRPIRVTIDVGAAFPATGAVAAKAWFAWASDEEIDDLIERHGLPGFTEHSITDARQFHRELAAVRERGYSTSIAEYYPDHNAVAATVFDRDGRPQFLFVVVGTTSQLSGEDLDHAGREVAVATERATKRLGGRHPAWEQPTS